MKNNILRTDNCGNNHIFFIISYFFLIFETLLSELGASDAFSKTAGILCIVFAYIVILGKINKRKVSQIIIVSLSLIITLLLTLIASRNESLIHLIILSLASSNIPRKMVIKTDLIFKLLLFFAVLLAYSLGFMEVHEFSRGAGEVRNSLGFHHPNFAGLIILNIFLDILYLRKNKKITNLVIGLLLFLFIHVVVDSRSAECGILIAAIISLFPVGKILRTKKRKIITSVILVMVNVGVTLYFLFSPMTESVASLDTVLSGRISISRAFYSYYGVNLTGNEFKKYGSRDLGGNQFYVLDNAYAFLLIHNGILIFVAIILFYITRLSNSIEEDNNGLFAALAVYAFIGLMEQATFQPIKNPFILLSDKDGSRRSKV